MSALSTSQLDVKSEVPVEILRSDYKPCDYTVSDIFLSFQLDSSSTVVTSESKVLRKGPAHSDLILDGEELELLSVKVNGMALNSDKYEVTPTTLKIFGTALPSEDFDLELSVKISPVKNLALSGLYSSGAMLCTQCEAMGFRRITYHMDRPDVLSRYKVRLEGDEQAFPCLLSNGNKIDSGKSANGKHWALWEDPFLKPSYLFALVAGDLGFIQDEFVTSRGLKVSL
eukprot:gene38520-50588_t